MGEKPIRVIVADDEPIIKMDLRELLTAAGYEVAAEASDGIDAVSRCTEIHPDLVLLDIKMPYMDGLSAAKIIQKENLAGTVMLITAYSDKEFVEKAKGCAIAGYLVKPIDERSLIPQIEMALNQCRTIRLLKRDVENAQSRLRGKALVEQAKGLLMEQNDMTEQAAYTYIRDLSQRKSLPMHRIAELILSRNDG